MTIVMAQPPEVDEHLSIIYPPISHPNRYENSSVMLEVNVRLWKVLQDLLISLLGWMEVNQ